MAVRQLALVSGGVPRVNLMPRSETQRRDRDALTRKWVWGVFGAVVVAALLIGAAFALKLLADQQLVAEQAKTNSLLVELSSLSEVSAALSTEEELTQFRAEAGGADFGWGPVIATVRSVLPAGVELSGFDLTAGGVPQTADPASEVGLTGTVLLDSPSPIDMAATIRALRAVPGVIYADGKSLQTSTVVDGSFQYLLTVVMDQSIYSNAFVAPAEGEN